MIKLITPPSMLLTVALLAIYSVYAFQIGSIEKSWALLAWIGIAAVASHGIAMVRTWSRYLVYLLTLGFIAKLGHSIYAGVVSRHFDFKFGSVNECLKALMPSAMMALLSCLCCVLVFRHLPRARENEDGIGVTAAQQLTNHAQGRVDAQTEDYTNGHDRGGGAA